MIRINTRVLRKLEASKNPFLSLCNSIIGQQISTKAGDAIRTRFIKLFGRKIPSPKALLSFSEETLRGVGLSGQKISYLRDLADKFIDGTIEPKKFPTMSDEEIREHLIRVKGVGRWTADMFLIFALNRKDVLPTGDLGIQKGFQKVFNLKSMPNEKKMILLATPYNKNRTKLSLFLWHSLDSKA